jgi:hypothetical protein
MGKVPPAKFRGLLGGFDHHAQSWQFVADSELTEQGSSPRDPAQARSPSEGALVV